MYVHMCVCRFSTATDLATRFITKYKLTQDDFSRGGFIDLHTKDIGLSSDIALHSGIGAIIRLFLNQLVKGIFYKNNFNKYIHIHVQ